MIKAKNRNVPFAGVMDALDMQRPFVTLLVTSCAPA